MICEEAGEDTHVVLVLDGAGWHKSKGLVVPASMTLLFLPPLLTGVDADGAGLAVDAAARPE